jgi:hypothetical protein
MRKLLLLTLYLSALPIILGLTDKAEARDCSTYGKDAGTTAWM